MMHKEIAVRILMCGFLKRSADSFIPEVGQSQDAQTLCAKIDQTLHDVEEYYEKHPAGRYLYSRNGHPNATRVESAVATHRHLSGYGIMEIG